MAKASINDETITRYAVRHHRFDPETNHFRWFTLDVFDNKEEFKALFEEESQKLELRRETEDVHFKEQIAGEIREPEGARGITRGWSEYK